MVSWATSTGNIIDYFLLRFKLQFPAAPELTIPDVFAHAIYLAERRFRSGHLPDLHCGWWHPQVAIGKTSQPILPAKFWGQVQHVTTIIFSDDDDTSKLPTSQTAMFWDITPSYLKLRNFLIYMRNTWSGLVSPRLNKAGSRSPHIGNPSLLATCYILTMLRSKKA